MSGPTDRDSSSVADTGSLPREGTSHVVKSCARDHETGSNSTNTGSTDSGIACNAISSNSNASNDSSSSGNSSSSSSNSSSCSGVSSGLLHPGEDLSNGLKLSGNMSAAELKRLYSAQKRTQGKGTFPLRAILSCKGLHSEFHPESASGSFNQSKIFQHYLLKQRIGSGSWGEVFIGVERVSGIQRAVKRIPKSTPHAVALARQEVALMKDLDHPNIVRVFDCFDDTAYFFVVMELCRGGELFDEIVRRSSPRGSQRQLYGGHRPPPFSRKEAALLMYQVLSAAHCCHKHGICHRDIKPENFLFAEPGSLTLKLADFGLAKRFRPRRAPADHKERLFEFVDAAAAAASAPVAASAPAAPAALAAAAAAAAAASAAASAAAVLQTPKDAVVAAAANDVSKPVRKQKQQQQQKVEEQEDERMLVRSVVGTACFAAPEVLRLSKDLIDKIHEKQLQACGEEQQQQQEQQQQEQQQQGQQQKGPQQQNVVGYDGERADAWSCGVLLYLLLCGEVPFDGPDDAAIAYNVLQSRPSFSHPVWREVPAETVELVVGLLQPDPAWRLLVGEALGSSFFSSVLPLHLPIPAAGAAAAATAALRGTASASTPATCSNRRQFLLEHSYPHSSLDSPRRPRGRCLSGPPLLTQASVVAAATAALTEAAAAAAAAPAAAGTCAPVTTKAAAVPGVDSDRLRSTRHIHPMAAAAAAGSGSISAAASCPGVSAAAAATAAASAAAARDSEETPQPVYVAASGPFTVSKKLRAQRLAGLRRIAEAAAAVAAAPTAAEVTSYVASLPFEHGSSAIPEWPWEDTFAAAAASVNGKRADVLQQQQQEQEPQPENQQSRVSAYGPLEFVSDSNAYLCWCSDPAALDCFGGCCSSSCCSGGGCSSCCSCSIYDSGSSNSLSYSKQDLVRGGLQGVCRSAAPALSHPAGDSSVARDSCCSRERSCSSRSSNSSSHSNTHASSNRNSTNLSLQLRQRKHRRHTLAVLDSVSPFIQQQRCNSTSSNRRNSSLGVEALSVGRTQNMWIRQNFTMSPVIEHSDPSVSCSFGAGAAGADAATAAAAAVYSPVTPVTPAALAGASGAAATLAMQASVLRQQQSRAAAAVAAVATAAGAAVAATTAVARASTPSASDNDCEFTATSCMDAGEPKQRQPHLHVPKRVAVALRRLQEIAFACICGSSMGSSSRCNTTSSSSRTLDSFGSSAAFSVLQSEQQHPEQEQQQREQQRQLPEQQPEQQREHPEQHQHSGEQQQHQADPWQQHQQDAELPQQQDNYVCALGQQELHLLHYTAAAEELLQRLRAATRGCLLRRQALVALAVAVRGSCPPSPSPNVSQQVLHLPAPFYSSRSRTGSLNSLGLRGDAPAAAADATETAEAGDWACCACRGARPLPFCDCRCHSAPNVRLVASAYSRQQQDSSSNSSRACIGGARLSPSPHSYSVTDIRQQQHHQQGGDSRMTRALRSSPDICNSSSSSSSSKVRFGQNQAGEELLRERRLLQFLFLCLDQDGDGLLSYRDFADGMLSLLLLSAIQRQLSFPDEEQAIQVAAATTETGAAARPWLLDAADMPSEEQWISWVSQWLTLHYELLVIGAEIDADGSGNIELSEFLAATLNAELMTSQLALRKAAFRILDRSGDGVLSLADLKSCMKETHSSRDPRELDIQLQAILSAGDIDGDGQVTLQDFEKFLQLS